MAQQMTCPQCGKRMVMRSRRSDGKPFWGCSGYPVCRKLIDYREEEPKQTGDGFKPSAQQQDIFDYVQDKDGTDAVIEAVAGSGKTTTLVQLLKYTSGKVAFVAFNKRIADELRKRAPAHVKCCTLHSLGFSSLLRALDVKPIVDEHKKDNIAKELLPDDADKYARNVLVKLTSLCQATLTDPDDASAVANLIERFDVEMNDCEQRVLDNLKRMLDLCGQRTGVVDFDDMCWMPIANNLPMEKYDWLMADECLPYKTPVLLADGSSVEIGKLVEEQMPVSVLAYDIKTGKQKYCRVTGWHKILNQKKMVKVIVRWCGTTGRKHSFLACTVDHKIWTESGYVEAGKLSVGMRVQVETSASRSQHYKITAKGRKVLSSTMTVKNQLGMDNNVPEKGWSGMIGGNGREMPVPQRVLLEALGAGWFAEYPIKTKAVGGRSCGYPTVYKADIANPDRMIVVEVDGGSHGKNHKERDDKKDGCLDQLGWVVYRVKNDTVMHHLDHVVAVVSEEEEDCPIAAEVVSVEPTKLKDWFVYDIDVEGCHNFYANSILVHNCQDLSAVQVQLILRSVNDYGRIIAVGDRFQSIYGFRGADTDAIPNLIASLNDCKVLPLSITYRCPASHVRLARQFVPHLEPRENAPEGVVETLPYAKVVQQLQSGDMVLCRINAPLVEMCYSLIRAGKKATIVGRDIGKGLIVLIDKMKAKDIYDLLSKIREYRDREMNKLIAAGKENQASSLEDRVECIIALCSGIGNLTELRARIETIFSDDIVGIALSSVHRAKGLESEQVFVLRNDLMPFPRAKQPWELEQERNIQYVAYTRSKRRLVFVQEEGHCDISREQYEIREEADHKEARGSCADLR